VNQKERKNLENELILTHERNVLGLGLIRRNCVEAGRLLENLLTNPPEGTSSTGYRQQLISKLSTSAGTIQRYRVAFRESKTLPKNILAAAKNAGLDINDNRTREALMETTVVYAGEPPSKIIEIVEQRLRQASENPQTRTEQSKQQIVLDKVVKFYSRVPEQTRKSGFISFVGAAAQSLNIEVKIF
jgi:hypothetical protein